ncbi:MAG: hypothetical protein IKW27_04845, partial [Bacteroidales bacterium]|nr:hypothetical protein [Bacteroidales bacterium]
WKNRARETLYSGCLLTLLVTKKRSTKVAIKLTPARAILTGDFFVVLVSVLADGETKTTNLWQK